MAPNMAVFGTISRLILKTIIWYDMPQKQILGRTSSEKSPTTRSEQKTYGHNSPYMVLVAVVGKKKVIVKQMIKSIWSKKHVHMVFQVCIYIYIQYIYVYNRIYKHILYVLLKETSLSKKLGNKKQHKLFRALFQKYPLGIFIKSPLITPQNGSVQLLQLGAIYAM